MLLQLPNHTKLHFFDEKLLLNKDAEATRVRAGPLMAYIPCIYVSGDFRDAYNLFAIISCSPNKIRPVAYNMGCDNGNAASFLGFVEFCY